MPNGVVVPTVPIANDIIMNEFKVYCNYGLPTQILLGVARGSCKFELLREIKEIEVNGFFGPCLYGDGEPNLRCIGQMAKVTVNMLYLKYFNRKTISNCESNSLWESKDWSATGGTFSAETTIVNSGEQSAKCTTDTSQHGIHEVFATSKNLNVFSNSEVSGTGDFIGFAIYISAQDLTDLGTADIRLSLHMDIEGTETNYYYYDIAASALTAGRWNTFNIAKSAFTETGTGDWTAVTGVSFKLDAAPSAEVVFYVDSLDLIQNQSDSSILPVNGHGFDYTNETTYKRYRPNLEITEDDYLDNITIIGQKQDGKKIKQVLKHVLNDGNINLAFGDHDEIVSETTFTGHYTQSAPTTCPVNVYEEV